MVDLGVLRSLKVALSSDPLLLVFRADICHSLTSNICCVLFYGNSDQRMDVRDMKAFKDGQFDTVLDKVK
jgi:hypothetical protein